MIHEVLIVPGAGYGGDEGYDPGHRSGALHEYDLLKRLVADLSDQLELQRIRHQVLPVMASPGIPVSERPQHFQPNQLVCNLRLGWESRNRPDLPNWSQVTYGAGTSVRLAKIVTDAVGQWGRCYVHGHQTRNPVRNTRNATLNVAETAGMLVVPFAVNGRQAHEYGRRLKALAESLAWAFDEYLGEDARLGKAYGGLSHAAPPKPALSHTWAGLPEWVLEEPRGSE